MAQLECKNLAIGYNSKNIANNINFSVNRGDYLCIVGENGSGKTTLMRTILGLHSLNFGEIVYDESCRHKIGYLPQQTEVQRDFPASVREIVMSGCQKGNKFLPFYSNEDKKTAEHYIKKCKIESIVHKSYRELSGGQQQRVLLARALCASKDLLFLDEPTAGLDQEMSQTMYDLLSDLNKNDKTTIIMITHDIDSAIKYATHILYLGKQNFFGTVSDYLPWECVKSHHHDNGGEARCLV